MREYLTELDDEQADAKVKTIESGARRRRRRPSAAWSRCAGASAALCVRSSRRWAPPPHGEGTAPESACV